MSLRGTGVLNATTASQPLLGTQTTAIVTPSPDLQTSVMNPASNQSVATVPVTAGTVPRFRVGDHVQIGATATFQQGNTAPPDGGLVTAINAAANTIQVQGLTRVHQSGEWVVLALPCAQVILQVLTGGTLYLAEDATASSTAASPTLISELSAGGVFNLGYPSFGNVVETQRLWVASSASNSYLAPILTI